MIELRHEWLGRIAYESGLQIQNELVQKRRNAEVPDTVLYLEHEPVYTIGRTSDQTSLRGRNDLPHPVFETNRGGQATWHGPGQLTVYPILDLHTYGADLNHYLRALEQAVIEASARYGVSARRLDGLTGVWVDDRKLASIGVGVRHWISMHGVAINTDTDLSGFEAIVPCGLAGVRMTSVSKESGINVTSIEFSEIFRETLSKELAILRLKS